MKKRLPCTLLVIAGLFGAIDQGSGAEESNGVDWFRQLTATGDGPITGALAEQSDSRTGSRVWPYQAVNPDSNGENPSEDNWFKKLISSGEFLVEETYVGESGVRTDTHVVSDFDEHDTLLRYVMTPRVSLGVLRIGADWERFSFGFPSKTPLPNTLQSAALVLGIDTQFSDSILVRAEAEPGFYGTNSAGWQDFNTPFIVGGTYIYNPNLQIIVGVSVDIDRKYPVLPGAGLRWKVAPEWVVNAVLPKPRIEYAATRYLTTYFGAEIKETNFRAPDDFGVTHRETSRLNNAVLTYSEVRVGLGADWKLASFLTATVEAGYQPYRSFDYYRADVRFHEDGSAPYGMISLHGAF